MEEDRDYYNTQEDDSEIEEETTELERVGGRGTKSRIYATQEGTVKISVREESFIAYYIGEANFNAGVAAKLAGYKPTSDNLNKMGYRVLNKPDVRAYLNDQLRLHGMSVQEIIYRLTKIARGSLEDYITFDDDNNFWYININKAKHEGKLYNIDSIKRNKGSIDIKLQNRMEALEKLARIHGMLQNGNEGVTNVVNIGEVKVMTNDDRRARIMELIEQAERRRGFDVSGEEGEVITIERTEEEEGREEKEEKEEGAGKTFDELKEKFAARRESREERADELSEERRKQIEEAKERWKKYGSEGYVKRTIREANERHKAKEREEKEIMERVLGREITEEGEGNGG